MERQKQFCLLEAYRYKNTNPVVTKTYQNPESTITSRQMADKVIRLSMSRKAKRNHQSYSTPANPRIPINTAFVGMIIMENPSPKIKACTAICLETPRRSLRGAIKGIVTHAWPLPEGTNRLSTVCTNIIPTEASSGPTLCSGTESA